MAPGASEDDLNLDRAGQTHALANSIFAEKSESNVQNATAPRTEPAMPRRTPRVSLIVVLPENHVVSPDLLAQGLRAHGNQEIDVVVACAGQPTNLSALQRSVGEAQFVLAPAGT